MAHLDLPTDDAVLAELGARLSSARLSHDLTQAQLAREAGVSKRTVERLEAGESAQLTSFIRVLRALRLLDRFQELLPPERPAPMDLLRREGRTPRRASGRGASPDRPWTWGEEDA
ncbi:MAG: helix-turn-helix domain-containing protein [Gemmatimonadota bacterium]|nr:helix-turn-helix domain-containing protein [Gemmatimonadota bacterium]